MTLQGPRLRPRTSLQAHYARRRSTFQHIASWLTDARNLTSQKTVVMLIGNKKDLESSRDVTFDEASQFAKEHGMLSCLLYSVANVHRSLQVSFSWKQVPRRKRFRVC
jgi:GTPase SAR1 family protein